MCDGYNPVLRAGETVMRVVRKALTFDDVLLVPAHSTVVPRDVNLQTRLTKSIILNTPLLSAAMDTVTDARLAIAIAQEGGLGIVHKNMMPARQAAEVAKVKRFESGVVKDPITIPPTMSVREVLALARQHRFSGMPVVDGRRVVGIVTNRDTRFETNLDQPVANIMTKRDRLVTVPEGTELEAAKELMHRHRLERVLVVNGDRELRGLITVKDIFKATDPPLACKDQLGRLRVGAAVGVAADNEERVEGLVAAGVDVLVVDTAHGHSQGVLDRIAWIKKRFASVQIIGGNIATGEGAEGRGEHGADGVKVGSGRGSLCTTRSVGGVGVPQISAIQAALEGADKAGVPASADRGVRYSGDTAKALAAAAPSVMLGSLFAGTDESPGEIGLCQGRSYKSYRGMGSLAAMQQGSSDRYFQELAEEDPIAAAEKLVPEGIEGRVPYKGALFPVIHQLMGGVRAAMGYCGCATIDELRTRSQFVEITSAGVRESHVHDVQIVKEAPNYNVE